MSSINFPAVATVIGLSQEVAESGPLLATLAVDPNIVSLQPSQLPTAALEIQAEDPVTQAVVDNIIGKHPTKKEPLKFMCELCKIYVSSEEILNIHYNGAKHSKKLKGQEIIKELNSCETFKLGGAIHNELTDNVTSFSCQICNVTVNSSQQLQQHLTGTKHKSKAETNKLNTTQVSLPSKQNEGKGQMEVNIGPNRLYCAACNVHVNSDLQLHQHIISKKHTSKINGRTASKKNYGRVPYNRPKPTAEEIKHNYGWKINQHIQKYDLNWPKTLSGNNPPSNPSKPYDGYHSPPYHSNTYNGTQQPPHPNHTYGGNHRRPHPYNTYNNHQSPHHNNTLGGNYRPPILSKSFVPQRFI